MSPGRDVEIQRERGATELDTVTERQRDIKRKRWRRVGWIQREGERGGEREICNTVLSGSILHAVK